MKKSYIIFLIIGVVLAIAAVVFVAFIYPNMMKPIAYYNDAVRLYNDGNYVAAALRFEKLKEYGEQAKISWLKAGDASLQAGELAQARIYYTNGGADEAVFDQIDEAYYNKGVEAYAEDERIEAENCFDCITHDSPYTKLVDPVRISSAERFLERDDFDSAQKIFRLCATSYDAEIAAIWLDQGRTQLDSKEIENAALCFSHAMIFAVDKTAAISEIDGIWSDAGEKATGRGDYEFADMCFGRMSGGSEQIVQLRKAYDDANTALSEGRYLDALGYLEACAGFRDAGEKLEQLLYKFDHYYAANGAGFYAVLRPSGSIEFFGKWNNIPAPVWTDVTSIAVGSEHFLVGLKSDGTLRFTGNGSFGNADVDSWKNVAQIACGRAHTVALKNDGTVIACGDDSKGQVSGLSGWKNIKAVAACGDTTYGLTNDGRIVSCGGVDTSSLTELTDIVSIACGYDHLVCLKADGTVAACGSNESGQCKVEDWTDIVAIYAGGNHTVGLKADGTLVACGSNAKGECNVDGVEDVLTVACGENFTLILLRSGTQVKLGKTDF